MPLAYHQLVTYRLPLAESHAISYECIPTGLGLLITVFVLHETRDGVIIFMSYITSGIHLVVSLYIYYSTFDFPAQTSSAENQCIFKPS